MKTSRLLSALIFLASAQVYAQETTKDKEALVKLVATYSQSVAAKDSFVFYELFNEGQMTWAASYTERTLAKERENNAAATDYFEGNYQRFMRGLFKYQSTEDKFDNIRVTEDGKVAAVTMDYSFWANGAMTNWGSKHLSLIKRNGKWKITSVIYSLDLIKYFEQPPLTQRKKAR